MFRSAWLIGMVALGKPPSPRAAPNQAWVMTGLDLSLAVDYERSTLRGTARLRLRNHSARALRTVPLLLGRLMTVSRVSRGPVAERYAQRAVLFVDDSTLQVNAISVALAQPVQARDSIDLDVDYGGVLVGYVETGSLYIQDHVSPEFTIIREDAFAFPGLGVPSRSLNRAATHEPFQFTLAVTVPSNQVVAAGGEPADPIRRDSLVTWRYRSRDPVPFLNVAIAPFQVLEGAHARIFHFPADSTGARMLDAAVGGALDRFGRWFGPLDRQPRLVITEIPEGYGSQASLTGGIIQTADAFRDRSELRQVYHELSHLWNVPDRDAPSPRWNEGLASYLQWRVAIEQDGATGWEQRVERAVTGLREQCAPREPCGTTPLESYGRTGLTDRSYTVGMLMFDALARTIGVAAFDSAYRAFYREHRAGGTTRDLAAAFVRVDSASARVFADWLYSARWLARLSAGETYGQIVESYRK